MKPRITVITLGVNDLEKALLKKLPTLSTNTINSYTMAKASSVESWEGVSQRTNQQCRIPH